MKNAIHLSCIILFVFGLLGCQKTPPKTTDNSEAHNVQAQYHEWLLGEWQGVDENGKQGGFIFMEGGEAFILVDGEKMPMSFQLDSSKDPIELDFVVRSSEEATRQLVTIIRFTSETQISIRTFFTEERPTRFLEEGEEEERQTTMILHKVQ